MRQPSHAGDAIVGAGVAIVGAALALHFSGSPSTHPPIHPSTPSPPIEVPPLPSPSLPSIQTPTLPEIHFDPQQFFSWLHPERFDSSPSAALDLAQMSPEQMRSSIGMRVYKAVFQTPDGAVGSCASFPIASNQIATALHCIQGDTVQFLTPDDSQQFSGQVVWTDPNNDAAIVRVDSVTLQPFPLAQAQPGELVWAFGYPQVAGGRLTVTPSQIISTQSQGGGVQVPSIELPEGTYYPGNSGGPLINGRGEVVGIAHAITERSPHIGFAIPVSVLPVP